MSKKPNKTGGVYRKIPGTNYSINENGYVIRNEDGKFMLPSRTGNKLHYNIGSNTGNWSQAPSRLQLLANIWGIEVRNGRDKDLYKNIRNTAIYHNQKNGFSVSYKREDKKRSSQKQLQERPFRKKLTNKPCPDGRSRDCTRYLPEGYHIRCHECWKLVNDKEGYDNLDFNGRMVGSD